MTQNHCHKKPSSCSHFEHIHFKPTINPQEIRGMVHHVFWTSAELFDGMGSDYFDAQHNTKMMHIGQTCQLPPS